MLISACSMKYWATAEVASACLLVGPIDGGVNRRLHRHGVSGFGSPGPEPGSSKGPRKHFRRPVTLVAGRRFAPFPFGRSASVNSAMPCCGVIRTKYALRERELASQSAIQTGDFYGQQLD